MNIYKKIYKEIKKYNNIVIARHIGADPDALGSSLALRDIIKNNFPKKNILAVGLPANRFKFMGIVDKFETTVDKSLLIVLDTPDVKRIDGVNLNDYDYIIKIDHHPFIEKYGNLELIDDSASSTCQMLLELFFATKLKITKEAAEKLYLGIVADTDRFLHGYTTTKTLTLVAKLLKITNIDFTSLYDSLYFRNLAEIRFQGYIYQNISITDNGLAYIKINDKVLKDYNVDPSSAGNMVNNLKYVNEILVWSFFTEDVKSGLIKVNIRSRGPYINDLAMKYGGGGHKFASGIKLTSWELVDEVIESLDNMLEKYNEKEGN